MEVSKVISTLEKALEEYKTSGISLRDLSAKYKVARGVLSGFLLGRGVDIYSKKSNVNNYAFEKIETEEQAYWLGFLYADGCVRHYKSSKDIELTLQEQDYEHLIKFARFVDYKGNIVYREKQKAYRVCFGSAKMHDDLVRLGCVERKSLVLRFPKDDIVPFELQRHFIRGYFDGDGCLSITLRKDYTFRKTISVLGTRDFLEWMVFYLPFKVSTKCVKKCKDNDSDNYYIQLNKNDSAKFLDYIYSDCSVYLDRKYLKYLA